MFRREFVEKRLDESKKRNNRGGARRGEKETVACKPHEFGNLCLPMNAASDWCSACTGNVDY